METNELIKKCNDISKEHDHGILNILYILNSKKKEFKAIAISNSDPDEIYKISINDEKNTILSVLDWDFSLNEYLFYDLEDGYKIQYMPLDTHYDIWCDIDHNREEIYRRDGLQLYLKYCKKNNITSTSISLLELEKVDITDMYKEENQGYSIIHEVSINNKSFVIGHKPKGISPYVTWETTPNRSHGYGNGHYFMDFNAARNDLNRRCNDCLQNTMDKIPIKENKPHNFER